MSAELLMLQKTTQIVFPPTEAAAAAPVRSAGAAMLLRLFLHLSDKNMEGCSHSCEEGRVGPATHPPPARKLIPPLSQEA